MFGIYGLKINRDNPVDPVQMHSLSCAESQAAPESKGEALGQWQHGSREAKRSRQAHTASLSQRR